MLTSLPLPQLLSPFVVDSTCVDIFISAVSFFLPLKRDFWVTRSMLQDRTESQTLLRRLVSSVSCKHGALYVILGQLRSVGTTGHKGPQEGSRSSFWRCHLPRATCLSLCVFFQDPYPSQKWRWTAVTPAAGRLM